MSAERDRLNNGRASNQRTRILVMGVGCGGCNAISRMTHDQIPGIEYVAVNTDRKALEGCLATETLLIGGGIARGRATRGNADLGKKAAQENLKEIGNIISGIDILFITAGMGGGTGTGAAPVIASLAKGKGIFTVGIVTLPFNYEGKIREKRAAEGTQRLREEVDTLIAIQNDKLGSMVDEDVSFDDAMSMASDVLSNAVKRTRSVAQLTEGTFDANEVRRAIAQGVSEFGQHIFTPLFTETRVTKADFGKNRTQ